MFVMATAWSGRVAASISFYLVVLACYLKVHYEVRLKLIIYASGCHAVTYQGSLRYVGDDGSGGAKRIGRARAGTPHRQ